ncbi:hypothetical protein OVN20_03685 [Microcella daejeonensis]|uniref:hypothetical protein n=1 Tax=Microcella daejeonensis TaxID=2994971 RepID=UPI00226F24B0|nr:hypothetical protein [Microcella daejeonensis]WAB84680.1 hypothetical protein OVN20_03685 [Microcella daejeonensis]
MATWLQRMNARRAKTGDGSPMPRFRWWQLLSRSVFELPPAPGRPARYTVDVRHAGDRTDGAVRARLYRDGGLTAVSKLPTAFPVEGGAIEVAVNSIGLRRCHFVPAGGGAGGGAGTGAGAGGGEQVLTPLPASAEGRRARFDREHPAASRLVGALALAAVLIGVAVGGYELVMQLSSIPAVVEAIGVIERPFRVPLEVGIAVGAGAVLGGLERTLRLRSTWLDEFAT